MGIPLTGFCNTPIRVSRSLLLSSSFFPSFLMVLMSLSPWTDTSISLSSLLVNTGRLEGRTTFPGLRIRADDENNTHHPVLRVSSPVFLQKRL